MEHRVTGGTAAAAVAAGVALALGLGELLAGLIPGVPSLVTAVGSLVIPLVPPVVKDWAVQVFGTSDKVALNTGTVVIALAVGVWVGRTARDRFATAVSVFAGFAAFGVLAAAMQPVAAPALVAVTTTAAAGAGLLALWGLLRVGGRAGRAPDAARRDLLAAVAGVAVSAAVAGWAGRSLLTGAVRRRDVSLAGVEPVRRQPPPGAGASFGQVGGLTPVVVPNEDFYRIDTALTVPAVDPATWRLRVTGMVDRDVELTYDDLLGMDLVEAYVTLACVSNEVGDDLVGNAEWLGVPLPDVLDRAGVADGATQLVGRAVDGWTAGFPTEIAFDGRDAMVAVGMNGEPLPAEHGFPARLIVPGLYGYVSATKWLTELELTTFEAFDAYWIPRGWAERGPVKTQSRIDVPAAGEQVAAGRHVVAGVAWAGHRGISAVEVRVDDGAWRDCELTEPLSQDAWRQFRRTVALPAGEHTLTVRATDGDGRVQTARSSPPRPDGATGRHRVSVTAV